MSCRAVIDELVIRVGGVGPAPGIGEGVELRLAYLPARLAKEHIVIGVRIKRRIEINQIDARVGKFFPIRKPFQIVAEIQPIHRFTLRFTRYWIERPTSHAVSHNECSQSQGRARWGPD